jgi:hypothetical protein
MKQIQELEVCLNDFCKSYGDENNNIAAKLLVKTTRGLLYLTRYVIGGHEQPAFEEEWLDAVALCAKYPIMTVPTTHSFIRYTAKGELDFVRWEGKKALFQPAKLFIYIVKNRSKFTKMHARLKRNNYFKDLIK